MKGMTDTLNDFEVCFGISTKTFLYIPHISTDMSIKLLINALYAMSLEGKIPTHVKIVPENGKHSLYT